MVVYSLSTFWTNIRRREWRSCSTECITNTPNGRFLKPSRIADPFLLRLLSSSSYRPNIRKRRGNIINMTRRTPVLPQTWWGSNAVELAILLISQVCDHSRLFHITTVSFRYILHRQVSLSYWSNDIFFCNEILEFLFVFSSSALKRHEVDRPTAFQWSFVTAVEIRFQMNYRLVLHFFVCLLINKMRLFKCKLSEWCSALFHNKMNLHIRKLNLRKMKIYFLFKFVRCKPPFFHSWYNHSVAWKWFSPGVARHETPRQ